jgi:hypothetical protein
MTLEASDTLTREKLESLLGIPSMHALYERCEDWILEHSFEATKGLEMDTPEWEAAEEKASDYTWGIIEKAYNAGFSKAIAYLEEKFLVTIDLESFQVSSEDWDASAVQVIDCINGYGLFYFRDPEDLVQSGPYEGTKGAVLRHLHWIQEWGAVYGEGTPAQAFEREAERTFRWA